MIKEIKDDSGFSRPACTKPNVSCATGLYKRMLDFAGMIIRLEKSSIDSMDLVHDLLIEIELTEDNFKSKIRGAFYKEKGRKNSLVSFEFDSQHKAIPTDSLPCKYCSESLPVNMFRTIISKDGRESLFTTACINCEGIGAKKRIKKFCAKQKKELGDYYIKRLLLRFKEVKDISLITNVDIEIKRTSVLLSRISKCFKYKDYARTTYKRPKALP